MYDQIIQLRKENKSQLRGVRFEQIVREILPWSFRPPIAVIGESEQLDAFFEWHSWHFLVEVKAKCGVIHRGSADWEDFELKVRKRQGGCIGLFCSLYPVSEKVIEAAYDLNRQGFCTLILHGLVWDELNDEQLPFDVLLRYCILIARSKFKPIPGKIVDIRAWFYDKEKISSKIYSSCRSLSALYLRRHRHPRHSEIYVPRELDKFIQNIADNLMPSKLFDIKKKKQIGKKKITHIREKPQQICIIRDASGAGKTTLSVQLSLTNERFFGIGRAALESDIDNIDNFFLQFGNDYGIQQLISIDRPIIMVIDSLDEANTSPSKKKEIISLIRFLDELNTVAKNNKLLVFPLCLVFTIRDDYYRNWESIFEGVSAKTFINKFSQFTPAELDEGLNRYCKVYSYSFTGSLPSDTRRVLSVPFNLQVFSEAHEYEGPISLVEVFEETVLSFYFSKKGENLLKRNILGFTTELFLKICAQLSWKCVLNRNKFLSKQEILAEIKSINPIMKSIAEEILIALKSEQIINQDPENPNIYGFKHTRLIEYLVAYFTVIEIVSNPSIEYLEKMTSKIFESSFVFMFRVHDFIRYICKNEFPASTEVFEDYYSKSYVFMTAKLSFLRYKIASGSVISIEDIQLILKNAESSQPNVAWDSFFVLAAKNNSQPKEIILYGFELAWKANLNRADRWKIIQKISIYDYLFEEKIFMRLLDSKCSKEWEVYLQMIIDLNKRKEFKEAWNIMAGDNVKRFFECCLNDDWEVVQKMFDIIMNDKKYIKGDIL